MYVYIYTSKSYPYYLYYPMHSDTKEGDKATRTSSGFQLQRLRNCHSPKSLLAPLRLGICLVQIVQGHVLATIPYDSNNTSDTNGATKDWSSFG